MSTEIQPILVSALNEYVFCPRRCALKYIEGYWADNQHTAVGTLLHDHADEPGYEVDAGMTLLRALPLFSNRYGLSGKADIVEVRDAAQMQSGDKAAHSKGSAKVYAPVEYKKGKRRKFENDDVQLCAQALCLEEMFSTEVPEGFIYHAGSKRRRMVNFDQALRSETEATINAVRVLLAEGKVPRAILLPRCDGCSLRSVCLPELTGVDNEAPSKYGLELWA